MIHLPFRFLWRALFTQSRSAVVRGSAIKQVNCVWCKQQFHYQLERIGSGEGFYRNALDLDRADVRAHAEAEANLNRRLTRDFDCIPCEHCGKLQPFMVRRIKFLRLRKLFLNMAAVTLICATLVAFIDSNNVWAYEYVVLGSTATVSIVAAILILARNLNALDSTSKASKPHPMIVEYRQVREAARARQEYHGIADAHENERGKKGHH